MDKGRSLDVYGKYFYTNYDGMNFHAGDDRYKLDDVTSSVVRTGLRFASTDKTWNWYGGLAYEHTFNGDARGNVNGASLDTPSLQGNTGIGEVGLIMKPGANSPWTFDLTAKGYAGDRRGGAGSITAKYAF